MAIQTEKLVIKRQRHAPSSNQYRVRVTGDAYEACEQIALATNMSLHDIASRLILWASERVEIKED